MDWQRHAQAWRQLAGARLPGDLLPVNFNLMGAAIGNGFTDPLTQTGVVAGTCSRHSSFRQLVLTRQLAPPPASC